MAADFNPWALIAVVVIFCVVIGCFTILGVAQMKRPPGQPSERSEEDKRHSREIGFRFMFVFLLIGSAVLLAVVDKLDQGMLGLLSSVAGFILGGVEKASGNGRAKP